MEGRDSEVVPPVFGEPCGVFDEPEHPTQVLEVEALRRQKVPLDMSLPWRHRGPSRLHLRQPYPVEPVPKKEAKPPSPKVSDEVVPKVEKAMPPVVALPRPVSFFMSTATAVAALVDVIAVVTYRSKKQVRLRRTVPFRSGGLRFAGTAKRNIRCYLIRQRAHKCRGVTGRPVCAAAAASSTRLISRTATTYVSFLVAVTSGRTTVRSTTSVLRPA